MPSIFRVNLIKSAKLSEPRILTSPRLGGNDAADVLADRHGMVNMGEIIPDTGYYLLRTRDNSRSRRSVRDLSAVFTRDPEVDWSEFQGANIR